MRKDLRWVAAFAIMVSLGIGTAYMTSGYLSTVLNPANFTYTGNGYIETRYAVSTDMEHKTSVSYLCDFSMHSPGRDLRVPDSLTTTTGKYGRCYQWVYPRNLPINGTDLGILSESFSIEAWLNPQNLDQIISWAGVTDVSTGADRRLLVATNGSLFAQMTEPSLDFFSNAVLGMSSWTHVAFVYDSDVGTISWIINGTLDKKSEPGFTSSWNGAFIIGGSTFYRWNGKIDEFRIQHQALTASQVADDMNRPIRKIIKLTHLTPNADIASLALESGEIPQEVTADANGVADFDTFEYGNFFEARFTIFRNSLTIQSEPVRLRTGDEYRFSLTSYLSPSFVFVVIVIAFPLATAVAYVVKRATSKGPSATQ